MAKLNKINFTIFLYSLLVPVLFFFVSIYTINDYGETTDEKFDQHIGEFYYNNWTKKGVKGLEERFIPLQRNYGPFFDVIVVASNDFLNKKTQIIKNPVASYHFPVIIISTITLWVVFVFAYLNWGLIPALISAISLVLLPRFIGDSQNNLKDSPLMAFFSLTLLLYYLGEARKKVIYYFLAGIFLGLTYSIKINALIIIPIIVTWYLLKGGFIKGLPRLIVFSSLSLITALLTILIAWPFYQYNTFHRFVETFLTFKNHVWDEYILYLGQFYRGHEVPWHYPIVMFGVTTPIFYLFLILLGIFISAYLIVKKTEHKSPLLFLLLWLIFPPVTQVISKAPTYDGIRHFLTVLPPLSILIGFTIWKLGLFLRKFGKKGGYLFFLYILIIVVGYLQILLTDIRIHPYQIVFFNQLTGGVKGAKERFDLDYWGQSLKEAAEWINSNLPSGSRIWLTLPFTHHFPVDGDRFVLTDQNPDYKVNLIRGMLKDWDPDDDYLYPKRKPIYSLKVEGGEILQIFKLTDRVVNTK